MRTQYMQDTHRYKSLQRRIAYTKVIQAQLVRKTAGFVYNEELIRIAQLFLTRTPKPKFSVAAGTINDQKNETILRQFQLL